MRTEKRKKTIRPKSPATSSAVKRKPIKAKPTPLINLRKPLGISASVRRIVVTHPQYTCPEIVESLLTAGWQKDDVERRMSTIGSLKADALAVLDAAREMGWLPPKGAQKAMRSK